MRAIKKDGDGSHMSHWGRVGVNLISDIQVQCGPLRVYLKTKWWGDFSTIPAFGEHRVKFSIVTLNLCSLYKLNHINTDYFDL